MSNALIKIQDFDYGLNMKEVKDIIYFPNFFEHVETATSIESNAIGVRLKMDANKKFHIKKSFDLFVLEFLLSKIEYFSDNEASFLVEDMETYSQDDVSIIFSIELILLLKLFKDKLMTMDEFYFYTSKLDYVPPQFFDYLRFHLREKRKINKGSFKKNTNILETNKNSYEFPRDYETLKQLNIKTLLRSLNLPLVEIPKNKDNKNLIVFFRLVAQLKRDLKLKKFNFSLRVKKTKKDNQGMFIVDTNTIIVDPRYPKSFIHELGHYIYENKLAFTFNDKRYYPSLFKLEINRFRKKNEFEIKRFDLEKYSDDSEIFALWFENIGINNVKK